MKKIAISIKRLWAMLVVLCMLAAMVPVHAEGITVSVSVRSGAELSEVQLLDTLVANVSGGSAASRQWQVSTDAGTTWTDIAGETSAEYIVSAAQSGAKVRCAATVDGSESYSETVDIPNYTVNTPGDFSGFGTVTEENDPNDAGYRKYTAAADKFTVDGRGFVLLDTFDNDESTYYVTTTDAYGDLMALSEGQTPSGAQIDYDSNNTNAFLNGEFLTSGNKFQALGSDKNTAYKLPQGVINNINTDHTWWRFVNDYRKQNGVQSTYKAGVSLLSVTDFETYKSKLGVLDVFADANLNQGASDSGNTVADVYFVRDTNNWGGDAAIVMCGKVSDDRAQYGYRYLSKWANQYGLLRPAFYLKKSFFKTTKVDLAKAGASVISAIKANCDEAELLALYGPEDCRNYLGMDIDITYIDLSLRSGAELANVKLLDTIVANVNGDTVTDFKWQFNAEEGWEDIDGENSAEYIVSAAQAGKQMRCAAMVNGEWIYSAAVQIPNYTVNTPGDFSRFGTVTEGNDPNDAGYRKYTAAADKFTVDGREFVLLDTFDNDESTYYVTTTDAYGDLKALSDGETPSGAQIDYDSYNTNAFLNGEFLTSGNKFKALGSDKTTAYKLPQGVIDNINTDHTWWRFVNDHRKQNGAQSTYKAGVSLLSVTDFETYKSKLGVLDVFADANVNQGASDSGNTVADVYFVRDTNNWGGDAAIVMCGKVSDDRAQYGYRYLSKWANQYGLLRPAFYLKKDFFKTTELDLSKTGEAVLNMMRERYCIEDLADIYSEQELIDRGFTHSYSMQAYFSLYNSTAEIYSLNGATSLQANVTIRNRNSSDTEAVLLMGIYNEKGEMVKIAKQEVVLKAQSDVDGCVYIDSLPSGVNDNYKVSVMLWDSVGEMYSLTGRKITFVDKGDL